MSPAPPTAIEDVLPHAAALARGEADESDAPLAPPLLRDIGRVIGADPAVTLAQLDATLAGPCAELALRWLQRCGALSVLLPEVQALVGFHADYPIHHKDLWAHTLEVVSRTRPDPDLRWAALLHDIGKTSTRARTATGRVGFLRHEQVGAWLARGICGRLAMPAERLERIAFVIEFHARVNAYEKGWTDKAVRRLSRDAGARLDDLLAFASADYTTRRRERAARIRSNLGHLHERLAAMAAASAAPDLLPRGLGGALCAALATGPGPHIGEVVGWLRSEAQAGRLPVDGELQTYVDAALRRQAARGDLAGASERVQEVEVQAPPVLHDATGLGGAVLPLGAAELSEHEADIGADGDLPADEVAQPEA